MDERFQDRIDNYLLNRMDDAEKTEFLREVEQDEDKKEQLEFTQNVKDSICSREEKLQTLKQFQQQYEEERRTVACRDTRTEYAACCCTASELAAAEPVKSKNKIWLWISGIAAVFVVGVFVLRTKPDLGSSPNLKGAPMEMFRSGNKKLKSPPLKKADNDTIKLDKKKNVKTAK